MSEPKQLDLLAPGSDVPWPYESVRLLVERRAAEIKQEIARMAEAARRSIGQSTRLDVLHRRIERERQASALARMSPERRLAHYQHELNRFRSRMLDTLLTVPPGHHTRTFA